MAAFANFSSALTADADAVLPAKRPRLPDDVNILWDESRGIAAEPAENGMASQIPSFPMTYAVCAQSALLI